MHQYQYILAQTLQYSDVGEFRHDTENVTSNRTFRPDNGNKTLLISCPMLMSQTNFRVAQVCYNEIKQSDRPFSNHAIASNQSEFFNSAQRCNASLNLFMTAARGLTLSHAGHKMSPTFVPSTGQELPSNPIGNTCQIIYQECSNDFQC